jgi:hypothetical protein
MSRIAHEKETSKNDQHPADHFDLIGGVGFGAYVVFITNINNHIKRPSLLSRYVAIMLGALRMSIPDAMKELYILGTKITAGMPESKFGPGKRLELLREGIDECLERHQIPKNIPLRDPRLSHSGCKV